MFQPSLTARPFRRFFSFFPLHLAFLVIFSSILLFAQNGYSAEVTLAWDGNTDSYTVGYNVYIGTSSMAYNDSFDAEGNTIHTFSELVDGQTYYFAVTAYDADGDESDYSTEVEYRCDSEPDPDPRDRLIIDNGEPGTLPDGKWYLSHGTNPYGNSSLYSRAYDATYTFEASLSGSYEVSLWWTERPSRRTVVPVEIYDGYTLLDIIEINQKANGGKWNLLGTYEFSDTASVVIVSEGDGSTCADAVRFIPLY